MTLAGIKLRINTMIWKIRRCFIRIFYRNKLGGNNSQISVISCNCTGGVVMSVFGMKFMTPTVNLFFNASDFVKFCENLDYYLSLKPIDAGKGIDGYPIVKLGDIIINAVHYDSFDSFFNKWEERKKRVNMNKLFLIFSDRDGFESNLLPRIDKIPYPKVLFSNKNFEGYDFICKVPGYEGEETVGSVVDYIGITGKRVYSVYPFKRVFISML